jgi:hypothetical protein
MDRIARDVVLVAGVERTNLISRNGHLAQPFREDRSARSRRCPTLSSR